MMSWSWAQVARDCALPLKPWESSALPAILWKKIILPVTRQTVYARSSFASRKLLNPTPHNWLSRVKMIG